MRTLILTFSLAVLLCFSALAIAFRQFSRFLDSPASRHGVDQVVLIPSAPGMAPIGELLFQKGLIANHSWFQIYARYFLRDSMVHPGEYALSPALSPVEIVERVQSGRVVTYTVNVPPGARSAEIVRILADKELGDAKELSSLTRNASFARELAIPASGLEGYLFPDVYDLPRGLLPRALLARMVERYRKFVTADIIESARMVGLTEHELITLASLIEREDVSPEERRLYSAMLHNRLRVGLPLEGGQSEEHAQLLERAREPPPSLSKRRKNNQKDRWHTTRVEGLPPAPISNPSLSAILAAAQPVRSEALYRVRKPDGAHEYCADFECYNEALGRSGVPDPVHERSLMR